MGVWSWLYPITFLMQEEINMQVLLFLFFNSIGINMGVIPKSPKQVTITTSIISYTHMFQSFKKLMICISFFRRLESNTMTILVQRIKHETGL